MKIYLQWGYEISILMLRAPKNRIPLARGTKQGTQAEGTRDTIFQITTQKPKFKFQTGAGFVL